MDCDGERCAVCVQPDPLDPGRCLDPVDPWRWPVKYVDVVECSKYIGVN
jgi:hypothetical protein